MRTMNDALRVVFALVACSASASLAGETGEPVYLSFVRQSKPVAHYRLNDSSPEGFRNLIANDKSESSQPQVVQGQTPARIVPSISPHVHQGSNRINGMDFDNTGLAFVNDLSRSNSAVILPGAEFPDFAEPHADELSLSVWVKALPQQVDRAGFISRKAGDGLDSYQFALSVWGGYYDIVMNQPDGTFRSFFTQSRPNGDWQHLVVVLDSKGWYEGTAGMLRFYINGERVFTAKTGNHTRTQLISSRENLVIGGIAYQQKDSEGFNNGFNGIIDEITIWDRALNDREVSDLFKSAIIGRKPMVIIVGEAPAGHGG